MLRFTMTNGGLVEVDEPALAAELLKHDITAQRAAEAEQRALQQVYRVDGEPNPAKPHNGLLTERLDISATVARQLITSGRIGYVLAGEKKGYRVTEADVRDFLVKNRHLAA